MSLYFEERIEEQKEDPENDKIIFTYPWIIEIPPPNEQYYGFRWSKKMVTSYNFASIKWYLDFDDDEELSVKSKAAHFVSNGICNISYTLFYDNDMRFELYSSVKTQMEPEPTTTTSETVATAVVEYESPAYFFQKLVNPYIKRKIRKLVIHLEVILPLKTFNRPIELPSHFLNKKFCTRYPKDFENDFKFAFLKEHSDYSIKCSDGTVPALRMVVTITSKYMKKHLKKSKDVELMVVDYSIDVVKPIVYYLHSECFQMPKTYDLNFADRLFEAIDFFRPVKKGDIQRTIELSLCKKFVKEDIDFNGVLQWLRISIQHRLRCLWNMICALIANKFYFKWQQIFPQNARNPENPLFREIFDDLDHLEDPDGTFALIESTFFSSLFNNVILD